MARAALVQADSRSCAMSAQTRSSASAGASAQRSSSSTAVRVAAGIAHGPGEAEVAQAATSKAERTTPFRGMASIRFRNPLPERERVG